MLPLFPICVECERDLGVHPRLSLWSAFLDLSKPVLFPEQASDVHLVFSRSWSSCYYMWRRESMAFRDAQYASWQRLFR